MIYCCLLSLFTFQELSLNYHPCFQLVIGSAVYAFEEVCPERTDLIHKHYRKLCQLLVDVDEWGQVIIINMMTRYARSQFPDPNEGVWLKCAITKRMQFRFLFSG